MIGRLRFRLRGMLPVYEIAAYLRCVAPQQRRSAAQQIPDGQDRL